MRVDIVTLFPEAFEGFLKTSFVARAISAGKMSVHFTSPRDFGLGAHKSIDDTPYGGGSGMVMRVDVLVNCMESIASPGHKVLLTPQGAPLNQSRGQALAARDSIVLICGRYEGFDERIRSYVDEEISLGDFVMTGGEVAAMAVVDACVRLLPGVLGNEDSTKEESHAPETGLLEYPQYTRPAEFRDAKVPEVLTRGNHAEIARWRRSQAEERTAQRRPDLYEKYSARQASQLDTTGDEKDEKKGSIHK
jgi:tRNA (guanine37-N1)-methyltransferase